MSSVEARIKSIVAEQVGVEESAIDIDTHIAKDLGVTDITPIVSRLEQEVGASVPKNRIQNLVFIRDAIYEVSMACVKRIVAEQVGVKEEDIDVRAHFVEDLGADSLDTVELVMSLEEAFDVEISDQDAEKIRTVQQAIHYICPTQASAADTGTGVD